MGERRKLFSASPVTAETTKRRKLFSTLNEGGASQNVFEGGKETHRLQCRDCGFIIETAASTTDLVCPKCGAKNRFNVLELTPTPAVNPEAVQVSVKKIEEVTGEKPTPGQLKEISGKTFSEDGRRSLFGGNDEAFQKEFSEPSNDLEKNLKLYSGKTLGEDEVQKIFSCTPEELEEKGFARVDETTGETKINDSAFLCSKLFSKLIISVTKVLDLPQIERPKEDIIEELAQKQAIPEKGIILIKKAHRIPIEASFSEATSESEGWVKDSGIIGDLKLEFGGTSMSVKDFTKLLDERYDDAPENIIDILIQKGVIKIQGNQVDIYK